MKMWLPKILCLVIGNCCLAGLAQETKVENSVAKLENATFGAGCFWCSEAVFEQIKGVSKVESGFAESADKKSLPAEVCHFQFDPTVVTYKELLEIFWNMHDPTTPNRQGADVGPEYRSIIYVHNEQQRELAEHYKAKLEKEKVFGAPIVTEISDFKKFKIASKSHQDYYQKNKANKHCQTVIQPKIDKIRKVFADKVK